MVRFIAFLVQSLGLWPSKEPGIQSFSLPGSIPKYMPVATIQISRNWDVLGPFQIGTRGAHFLDCFLLYYMSVSLV
jgi:hypothetical protein